MFRPSVGLSHGPFSPQSQVLGNSSYKSREYGGVDMTIDDMRKMVKDSLLREQTAPMRKLCEEIISQVNPKDYLSEVAAVYYYALKNSRYTRDPIHVEYVQHPLVILQPDPWDRAAGRRAKTDDCEGISTTIAAMMMCIGNPCEFVTISTQPGYGHHHVFTRVKLPDGRQIVVDPIPGPNATRMLSSVVDHKVWPIEPVRVPGTAGWGVAGRSLGLGANPELLYSRQARMEAAAARHDVCRNPIGLGWTVADRPSAEWTGPCILGQQPVYSSP